MGKQGMIKDLELGATVVGRGSEGGALRPRVYCKALVGAQGANAPIF